MIKNKLKMKAPARGFFYGWVILFASFLIVFTMMAAYYTFGVFFKPMLSEFGWTRAQTSLAVTINMITGGIMAILIGRLVDRYSPRSIMIPCALLAGLSYVLMSRISGLGQLYILYGLILGVAMSAHYVIPTVLINRWFIKKRGLGLGLVFSAFGVAQMISPPLAASLVDSMGWRQMYIYIGAITFLITFVSALFMRSNPGDMGLNPDGELESKEHQVNKENFTGGLTLKEALHSHVFWLVTALWFFMAFPVYIMVVHLIPFTTDVGLSPVTAASILTVTGISNIVGRIILGHISDKYGTKLILLLSFALVIFGLLLLINGRSLPIFYLAGFLYSFFLNGGDTVVIKVMGDFFGLKSLGLIIGITSVAWRGGAAAGTYLAGFLFDKTDNYAMAFSLAALTMYVSFILIILIYAGRPKFRTLGG